MTKAVVNGPLAKSLRGAAFHLVVEEAFQNILSSPKVSTRSGKRWSMPPPLTVPVTKFIKLVVKKISHDKVNMEAPFNKLVEAVV